MAQALARGLHTMQKGLYSRYDAKVVGDYTGLTPSFDLTKTWTIDLVDRIQRVIAIHNT